MAIAFITGICLMSVSATIGAVLLDNGNDLGVLLCCGPAAWAALIVTFLIRKIQHWVRFHNRRSLLTDNEGKIYAIPAWAAEAYREEKDMDFISENTSESEAVRDLAHSLRDRKDEWGNYFLVAECPNVRYAPKSVWKDFEIVARAEARAVVKQYIANEAKNE